MNIANTNACRKTYLGKSVNNTIWDSIRMANALYDSTSNSIDISLMESTYKLLSPQIIQIVMTSLNNIRL
jgi:hypothetical protein